jgi:hypothetical protein
MDKVAFQSGYMEKTNSAQMWAQNLDNAGSDHLLFIHPKQDTFRSMSYREPKPGDTKSARQFKFVKHMTGGVARGNKVLLKRPEVEVAFDPRTKKYLMQFISKELDSVNRLSPVLVSLGPKDFTDAKTIQNIAKRGISRTLDTEIIDEALKTARRHANKRNLLRKNLQYGGVAAGVLGVGGLGMYLYNRHQQQKKTPLIARD